MFPYLSSIRRSAPAGELSQFSALAVANQYRVPYDLTLRHVPRGARVLDWGCGDGHYSYFLLEAGYDVVSYSLQHRPQVLASLAPELAQRSQYVQGNLSEPTQLPFPAASFDAVFSVGVLEHVREMGGTEPASLAEIRRVLRPGGLFLCFHLPNRYSYIEALARTVRGQRPTDPDHDHFHRYRFSPADAKDLFQRAGFTIVTTGRYAFLPRNMLARLPQSVSDSPFFTVLVNRIDDSLINAFNALCQNLFVVARA